MEIKTEKLGKRFGNQWIFRNLDLFFKENKSYAITGPNGSGKSTLLQVLAGIIPSSAGKIMYSQNNQPLAEEELYKHQFFVSPYQELPEEFSLTELLDYHLSFRKLIKGMERDDLINTLNLWPHRSKQISLYSSGMKQRVKLGLALFSEASLIILDEPATNLDEQNINWYRNAAIDRMGDALMLIGSNQKYEYDFCSEIINITQV
ncbi:ATP-binding cassette domain-containing protein [Cytophagaceae bacterium ABcell3]|nr:ATP-binding cassette domain-containing protein [Cytophagaceae bacterium ABcell3]